MYIFIGGHIFLAYHASFGFTSVIFDTNKVYDKHLNAE